MVTALALTTHKPELEILKKIRQNRKDLLSLKTFPDSIRQG